ncbi:malto-oligosyltrehalose synthase [Pararhizobium mangrovi]|uniref:Malto-oligosyltrehalose synthase n=1 Tax=Pararhizobium mangrovi TaxID=2590452 RepID=A0A506U960_9HYPH|nr:malto-oligosyltrehalose synthase [Pararhizobium mangrovi]TPW29621.1 malto-oligosyltrehalose synthase [Pararhizobium mangrovi]
MIELDATYRIQFRRDMTFDAARAIVPYLAELGVSHLYASPIFAATSGSTHGYDVTDHNQIDPVLGGEEGFFRLSDALKEHGLGLVLDIVPNHMAASTENPWWANVLEWGAESPFAGHFDIDWSADFITLPFLGADFDACLKNGEFGLAVAAGRLVLTYYENAWPLHPKSYPLVFERLDGPGFAELANAAGEATPGNPDMLRTALADAAENTDLPARLAELFKDGDLIKRLHHAQAWRLFEWREGRKFLTYRRFFEITGLVGVRVEDEPVFRDVHRSILTLVRSGRIDGLRIDHVDGLADPECYLKRLRSAVGPDVPIHVEKILEGDETLEPGWPVEGTTGYEFIAALSRLLADGEKSADLDRAYHDALGRTPDFAEALRAAKLEIITHNLEGELDILTRRAAALAVSVDAELREKTVLRAALVDVMAGFDVYRTYVDESGPTENDVERLREIETSLENGHQTESEPAARALIFRLLRLDVPGDARGDALAFARRFQQTTGPVMAKALEDTLFFRLNRLIALNEVGGEPERIDGGAEGFHAEMLARAELEPRGLSATATHDTKRGEDARARLYTISEAPAEWGRHVERWRAMHADYHADLEDGPAPDGETEWMLYQALLGAWPFAAGGTEWLGDFRERFLGFVEKAMREDKRRTQWTAVNEPYERTVKAYAERLVDPDNGRFLDDFTQSIAPFVSAGVVNSFAQTLLKVTAPGVPDVYNGAEGWDLSFVDPDNRRPVDFDALTRSLDRPVSWPAKPEDVTSGAAKQHLVAAALAARQKNRALFDEGSYEPVPIDGPKAAHALAFLCRHANAVALIVVPRCVLAMTKAPGVIDPAEWSGTRLTLADELAERSFTNALTGDSLEGQSLNDLATALSSAPVGFYITK